MLKKFLPQIVAMLFLAGFVAYAWTEPPSAPPAGNVDAPVNVSAGSQTFTDSKTLKVRSDGTGVLNLLGGLGVNGLLRGYSNAIFDGNVGIGTTAPTYRLDVSGDIRGRSLVNIGSTALPSCSVSNRGQQFLLQSGVGIEDGFYICKKKADGSYGWIALGSPKIVTIGSWTLIFALYNNTWTPIKDAYGNSLTDFSVPSDSKQWLCSYTIFGQPGTSPYCASGQSRIMCGGNEIYHLPFSSSDGATTLSNISPLSTNGLSCQFQFKSDCSGFAAPAAGKFAGNCYYIK